MRVLLLLLAFVAPLRAGGYAHTETAGPLVFSDGLCTATRPGYMHGRAWSPAVGWINFSPAGWSPVTVDASGRLSGFAWSETCGWISMAPTGGGATLSAEGRFSGAAWSPALGWLLFDAGQDMGYGAAIPLVVSALVAAPVNRLVEGAGTTTAVRLDLGKTLPAGGRLDIALPSWVDTAGIQASDLLPGLPAAQLSVTVSAGLVVIRNTGTTDLDIGQRQLVLAGLRVRSSAAFGDLSGRVELFSAAGVPLGIQALDFAKPYRVPAPAWTSASRTRDALLFSWEDQRATVARDTGRSLTWSVYQGSALMQKGDAAAFSLPESAAGRISLRVGQCLADAEVGTFDLRLDGAPFAYRVQVQPGSRREDYVMLGLPGLADASLHAQLAAVLGQENAASWRMFRWDAGTGAYRAAGEADAGSTGSAAWLVCARSAPIEFRGSNIPLSHSLAIPLVPGWNQVCSGFPEPVPVSSLCVEEAGGYAPLDAPHQKSVDPRVWDYRNGAYTMATSMEPARGYWIKNTAAQEVRLVVDRAASLAGSTAPRAASRSKAEGDQPPPPPEGLSLLEALAAQGGGGGGGCLLRRAPSRHLHEHPATPCLTPPATQDTNPKP